MPDNYESLSDDVADQLPEGARAYLRRLEAEVKDLRPLKDDNDRYKLKEDLRANGMDFSEKQLKALLASHEGESTPELLRKTAEELKFVEPLPATDAKDEAGHSAIDAARSGSVGAGTNVKSYEEEVNEAQNMDQLQEIAKRHGRDVLQREV